jgi:hypothetical protein
MFEKRSHDFGIVDIHQSLFDPPFFEVLGAQQLTHHIGVFYLNSNNSLLHLNVHCVTANNNEIHEYHSLSAEFSGLLIPSM